MKCLQCSGCVRFQLKLDTLQSLVLVCGFMKLVTKSRAIIVVRVYGFYVCVCTLQSQVRKLLGISILIPFSVYVSTHLSRVTIFEKLAEMRIIASCYVRFSF